MTFPGTAPQTECRRLMTLALTQILDLNEAPLVKDDEPIPAAVAAALDQTLDLCATLHSLNRLLRAADYQPGEPRRP